jgi:cell division protein FtsB
MRWLAGILLLLLLGLQYRLWVGAGSLADVKALRDEISSQKAELVQLRARNQTLEAEVLDLREGLDALEERARSELGMIKQGEIFLQVIEDPETGAAEGPVSVTGKEPASDAGPKLPPGGGDGLSRRAVAAEAGREH